MLRAPGRALRRLLAHLTRDRVREACERPGPYERTLDALRPEREADVQRWVRDTEPRNWDYQ